MWPNFARPKPYHALDASFGLVGCTLASRRACQSALSSLPVTSDCTHASRSSAVEIPSPAAQVHDGLALVQSTGASVPARAAVCNEIGSARVSIVRTFVPYM